MRTANIKLWGGVAIAVLVFSLLLIRPTFAVMAVDENDINGFVLETPDTDPIVETISVTTTDPLPDLINAEATGDGESPTGTDSNITFDLGDNGDSNTTTTTSTVTVDTNGDVPTGTAETIDITTNTDFVSPTTTAENTESSGTTLTTSPTPVDQSTIQNTVEKILNFFRSRQDSEGRIIDNLDYNGDLEKLDQSISEWSAISFAANNVYSRNVTAGGKSLLDHLKTYDLSGNNEINACTSYARHSLALIAAGFSPTQESITNLNKKMKELCAHDNTFGLPGTNDDIFGMFSLMAAGEINDPSINIMLNTIINDQQSDGSFTWPGEFGGSGPDITGASINALKYAQNKGKGIDNEIFTKAKEYLKTKQHPDGGWGCNDFENWPNCNKSDALNTSWAMMGINSLGENQSNWFSENGKNPWHFLTENLTLSDNNTGYYVSWGIDWFGTKHAVPALLGKSWPVILTDSSLTETVPVPDIGGSGTPYNPILETPTTTPTTTLEITIPTSTPTSTIELIVTTTTTLEMTTTTISTLDSEIATTSTPEIKPTPIKYSTKPVRVTKEKKTTPIIPNEVLGEKITTSSGTEVTESINEPTKEEPATEGNYRNWIKNIFFASVAVLIIIGLYITIKFRRDK
ncbi:MAG TPA: prenyltransferase/squalene oxidase repeat-containing protein [Patescibacteria group bacterium]|nr:prenyltransferase/squalene oxidase repeat-containing protein [Patescibacteria group bacterium]